MTPQQAAPGAEPGASAPLVDPLSVTCPDCRQPAGRQCLTITNRKMADSHGFREMEAAMPPPDRLNLKPQPARVGRPRIGDQIKMAFPADMLEQIDAARGGMSRSAWVREACAVKLTGG